MDSDKLQDLYDQLRAYFKYSFDDVAGMLPGKEIIGFFVAEKDYGKQFWTLFALTTSYLSKITLKKNEVEIDSYKARYCAIQKKYKMFTEMGNLQIQLVGLSVIPESAASSVPPFQIPCPEGFDSHIEKILFEDFVSRLVNT